MIAMDKNDYWILALSGGGARGLFTASILEQLEDRLGAPIATKFDLIAGTSVGGILALGIANEVPAFKMRELFNKTDRIFNKGCWLFNLPLLNLPLFSANYSSEHLKRLLEDPSVFGSNTIGDLKHRVIIPAINYTKGEPSFFKTPHHETFSRDWKHSLVDVALATSAAPTYFPIHRFNHQHYVDGGLVANAPGLVAVHEALHFAGKPDISKINVLSIGTAAGGTSYDPAILPNIGALLGKKSTRYWLTKGWGLRLFELTISSQEAMSNYMLRHWIGSRHHLIDVKPQNEQSKYLSLDDVSEEAKEALLGQALTCGQSLLNNELTEAIKNHQPARPAFYYGPNKTN